MYNIDFLQENIELAKRDWELTNLQALREEEEKIAEDETVEDVHLTYDRPDLCNKVTLRRSSTGVWKVCSSGQNNRLNHSANAVHEKTAQKVNSKETETSDKQILRSDKACSLGDSEANTSLSSVQDPADDPCVRPQQALKDDPDYMPLKHFKDTNRVYVVASHSSARTLRRCSEVCGESSSRTNLSCKNDVHMSGDGSKVISHKRGECSDPMVLCSNSSSENSTSNLEEEIPAQNNSTHKYPTRQKSIHQNDGDV